MRTRNLLTAPTRRFLSAALLGLVVVVPLGAGTADAAITKVDVCHFDVTAGTYTLVSVNSGKQVSQHLAHGDAMPGTPVPTAPDYVFGADCSLVRFDTDGDRVPDASDNCPAITNPDQADRYGAPQGDACEDTDADGIFDLGEADMCVSIDRVTIIGVPDPVDVGIVWGGTARCYTDVDEHRRGSNIAIANGANTLAQAYRGYGNTATAIGDSGCCGRTYAAASGGHANTATATGEFANAGAGQGHSNTATATGGEATASAQGGSSNTATSTGFSAQALAGDGDHNIASASGENSDARAQALSGCTASNSSCR